VDQVKLQKFLNDQSRRNSKDIVDQEELNGFLNNRWKY